MQGYIYLVHIYLLELPIISEWLSYLNYTQLFSAYPGISKPGPEFPNIIIKFSVFYHSFQGLIPFSTFNEKHLN